MMPRINKKIITILQWEIQNTSNIFTKWVTPFNFETIIIICPLKRETTHGQRDVWTDSCCMDTTVGPNMEAGPETLNTILWVFGHTVSKVGNNKLNFIKPAADSIDHITEY